jgi:hypothetical protein
MLTFGTPLFGGGGGGGNISWRIYDSSKLKVIAAWYGFFMKDAEFGFQDLIFVEIFDKVWQGVTI